MKRIWANIQAFAKDLTLGSGKRAKNDEATRCTAETNANNDRSSTEPDPPSTSQPKHKIFLSHSGAQKYFVENLCKDLEDHHRFPFFDIRESSLPKGERFPPLILEAAQHCSLAVVVVSEEYFTSKWPMIELVEFVRAKSGRNTSLKMLPLFMGLSHSEFSDQTRQEGWFRKWAEWAEEDPSRINVAEWKEAVMEVKAFNGMQFHQDPRKLASYQMNVVRMICKLVSPDVKWYDSHVQGGSNICKVYREQIGGIQPSGRNKVRVIGYYGVGGVGKTTMCKMLCNELALEFEDKVCHVEMAPNPSSSEKLSHLREVLKKLTRTSEEVLRDLNEDQCRDILCKSVSWEQPAFLALDNLWEGTNSNQHAKMFLQEAAFPEGSVVMVTARTLTTLGYVGIDKSQCFEVPELSKVDARHLFLYHAANGREYVNKGDIDMIDECVSRCYFRKSEKQGCHYLPLAVKVLGMHLGSMGSDPKQWLKSLPRVRDFNLHSPEENPVFGVIRLNYDRLTPDEQALFMDIVCYCPRFDDRHHKSQRMEWLGIVHQKKWEEIGVQLQRLKDKGLLEDVDVTSGEFSMHDLYREFAKLEVQGKLEVGNFRDRRFVYAYSHPSELEKKPSGGVWENLVRVGIEEEARWDEVEDGGILSLQRIQWRYCPNVVVLKLDGLVSLKGVLKLKGLCCLRSLELRHLNKLGGVEGLEDLENLAYFQWVSLSVDEFENTIRPRLGHLPESLVDLRVEYVGATVGREVIARCSNLCSLKLSGNQAHDGIDLPESLVDLRVEEFDATVGRDVIARCSNLRNLKLKRIRAYDGIDLPESLVDLRVEEFDATVGRDVIARCSNLRNLKLKRIRAYDGIDFTQCSSLLTLDLWCIEGLQELTGLRTECLQSLRINECNDLRDASGFEHSVGLREMFLSHNDALEKVPDLQKLTGLQILKVKDSDGIAEVRGLDSLRQLRELQCSQMRNLRELPSLSGLQHLHRLDLFWCNKLTGLEGVGDLPLLRYLDLGFCSSLLRLPELSKCTNLEKLDLSFCSSLVRLPELSKCTNLEELSLVHTWKPNMRTGMELLEEDIVMLSKLPKLRPVLIAKSHSIHGK